MRAVSPVYRLELIGLTHQGSVKAAVALAEGLKLASLEDLLEVVCVHSDLTPELFNTAADAWCEVEYMRDNPR